MLPAERRKIITDHLKEHGKVIVEDLAEVLSVSTMTIRRDLQILEEEDIVTRTYGGAVLKEPLIKEVPYKDKATTNISIKRKLALYASSLVHEGYTVILDAGTTNMEIAKQLVNKKDIKIVTNDVMIAAFLYPYENIEVYCCGGCIQKSTGAVIGSNARDFFKDVLADIIFIGANAVDLKSGITTPTLDKAKLKKQMLQAGEEKVLVCDSSKFGKKSFAKVCSLEELDLIITDTDLELEAVDVLKTKKVAIERIEK
ncbi:transcriptional regulator, DeoR family [Clostridium aceticum]|uniref:Transcriptional regulator, DeoR family n=1 Tax=Clostridium aceticum TaxID=84022 RepID=A0A0D8IDN7_9CLOT|nr:DeoR/GlpR family DNA-binding transcription regulator [Clostridium aceticum]AKL94390.1 transcriptional regulator, DeoR family [Clostridium aceticum]KJF28383.1 hypothetical protein TZ02_03185 [Clostridium aceticum]